MKISKFLPFTIFFFFTISLSGAVITWTGGTGNWDIASNWDTGTIPSADDDVIISSGHVTIPTGYSAVALSVSITNSSVLEIVNTGALQIDNAPVNGIAISTGASLLNAGVTNIDSSGIFGIQNSTGTFHNQSTGEIYITNAGTGGIKNYQTGAILTNDGLISINETGLGDGIYSETVIINNVNASIIIKNTDTNGLDSYGGFLTNYGDITIDSTGDDGMRISGNTFDNSGDVEISHCHDGNGSNGAIGIKAEGIKNSSGGSIYIHHAESSAIRTEGDLENSGLIEIYDNSYMGIAVVDGTLGNQETGEIIIKNNGGDAISLSLSTLENDGLLLFDNNTGKAINAGSGSLSYNNTNGTVKGNGLISSSDFYDSGAISPGDSIGSLEIFGYRPTLPTYNMEIVVPDSAGAPDGYDLLTLNISNSYVLQGTVNVLFLGSYTGASQDTFYMFSIPSGYTGNFNTINLPALPTGLLWETIYSADGVKFVIDGKVTWTGIISQDWNDPANWDKSFAPYEVNDVIIPDVSGASGNFPNSNTGTAMACNNLRIETGAQLTVPATNGALAVGEKLFSYGTLTIAPNADATISGDTYIDDAEGLVVEATSTGVGSFIDNGTINYGTSGTARVQTFISNGATGTDFWMHFIGPTVNAADYTGSGTGVLLGEFEDADLAAYAYEWDESADNGWVNIYDPTMEIPSAKGIALSTNDATDHTINITGELLTSTVTSPSLTYSNNHYELISNPYPSAIDFDLFYANTGNGSVIENKNWIWDAGGGGNYLARAAGAGGVENIQVGQGFFVETLGNGPVNFENTNRTHSTDPFRDVIINMLTLNIVGGGVSFSDELIIRFEEGATNGYDIAIEAIKWNSMYAEATMIRSIAGDGTELAINVLPQLDLQKDMVSVPVHFQCGFEGEYTFTAGNLESFEYGTEIWIEDKQDGNLWHHFSPGSEAYTFTAGTDDAHDRFIIHFFGPTSVGELEVKNLLIYSNNEYVHIRNMTNNEIIKEVYIYSIAGTMIMYKQVPDQNIYRFFVSNHDNYYIVRVATDKRIYTEKVFVH